LDKIISKNNDRYRAIYGNLENKINALYWPVKIREISVNKTSLTLPSFFIEMPVTSHESI
jgi:hypothetical protein